MEEVLRRFARLAGLTVEEAEQWQDLCGDAYVLLESQRKNQKDASCVGDLVCAAAAALAFYQYTLHQNAANEAAFTAGDVRISHNGKSVEWAKEFWLEARSHAAPLLKDPDFGFWEMKV